METLYRSNLSALFDKNQDAEEEFRKNRKNQFAATELAYIKRILSGENELKNLVSSENIKLIIRLTDGQNNEQ